LKTFFRFILFAYIRKKRGYMYIINPNRTDVASEAIFYVREYKIKEYFLAGGSLNAVTAAFQKKIKTDPDSFADHRKVMAKCIRYKFDYYDQPILRALLANLFKLVFPFHSCIDRAQRAARLEIGVK
jgi:hypothetical protein